MHLAEGRRALAGDDPGVGGVGVAECCVRSAEMNLIIAAAAARDPQAADSRHHQQEGTSHPVRP
jgi:hypothetical protein